MIKIKNYKAIALTMCFVVYGYIFITISRSDGLDLVSRKSVIKEVRGGGG